VHKFEDGPHRPLIKPFPRYQTSPQYDDRWERRYRSRDINNTLGGGLSALQAKNNADLSSKSVEDLAALILANEITIENVPEDLRSAVQAMVNDAATMKNEGDPGLTEEEKQAAEIINNGPGTDAEKKSLFSRALAWLRGRRPRGESGGIGNLIEWLLTTGRGNVTGPPTDNVTGPPTDNVTGPPTDDVTETSTGEEDSSSPEGDYPWLTTPDQVYKHIYATRTTKGLTEKQIADATNYTKAQPPGIIPNWLSMLLGLGSVFGGSSDPAPKSLQEAATRRSMEVYGDENLFDPTGPSPLQEIDPEFRDIKTFMPTGQVPDFGLAYRGVPSQMYANYEGTGPRGVAGLRGNITPKTQVAQVAQGGLMGLAYGGSTSYPRMNGQIAGPGTEKSDDIPAMLSDGEFVVNAAGVRGIGNLMGNKKPKSKAAQRREGARMMYALQKAGEKAARMT